MTTKTREILPMPITHTLNNHVRETIKWCTPSLDNASARVINPYESDISVSYQLLGFPSEPSGIFKKAYDQAAKTYGADHTLFSVNGSTGSNFIVLRALSKQIPNLRILAQRNVHKSVVAACEDYSINLMFVPPRIDKKLQIFLPNTINEILNAIKRTTPQVLLITNPTYEGIVIDLKELIKRIRKEYPDLIIFIEEAWGAHLHFSKKLPISAMEADADICIQSTHKQGGALQQAGMIHWKNGRINSEILKESYRTLSTSSPSYMLLASLDAAREMMTLRGMQVINRLLDIAQKLSCEINLLPNFKIITTSELKERNSSVFGRDESKIIVDITNTGLSGYQIAQILEDNQIIVEAYNQYSLLFLVPFRSTIKDIERTIAVLKTIKSITNKKTKRQPKLLSKVLKDVPRILELGDVAKLLANQIEKIPLADAQNKTSAENITPYPPGIPTTIKGEEFTARIIQYYTSLSKHSNSHIVANDKSLKTVLVVK
jgi:arginine decarboxylase